MRSIDEAFDCAARLGRSFSGAATDPAKYPGAASNSG